MKRSFGLDLARTLAISFVFLSHLFKPLDFLGFWGVELFFALSGYLIGQILWRIFSADDVNLKDVKNFWLRRWYRTLPNYFLFLLVMIPFHYFIVSDLPSTEEITKYLWFGQALYKTNDNFYRVSWSLCIEEWFYLLFPLVMYLVKKLFKRTELSFIIAILVFFCCETFIRYYLINHSSISTVRDITLARLDSIAAGVLVAVFSKKFKTREIQFSLVFSFAIFLSIIFYARWNNIIARESNFIFLIVPIGFSLMLPWANNIRPPHGKLVFLKKIIENISLWSYSIYLSHIPILFLLYSFFGFINFNGLFNLLPKIIAVILTLFVSKLIFEKFETKILHLRPKENH